MNLSKKTLLVITVGALVLLALVAVYLRADTESGTPDDGTGDISSTADATSTPTTRMPAPDDIKVPDERDDSISDNVAIPEIIAPAGQNTDSKLRTFSIQANENKFTPDTIIVRAGDTVSISVSAVDRDYDFTQPDYGFSVEIPKGTAKEIDFSATASGIFIFSCAKCVEGGDDAKGQIIISAE